MSEESYEMTRSSSFESFDDDEAQLLNKEEQEDLDIYDEDDTSEEYSVYRFIFIGVSIGLFFLVFKIIMVTLGHESHHTERGAEKLFNNGTEFFASTVILISLDGFRREYLDRKITPRMSALAEDGVMAKTMYPSFPVNIQKSL